MPIVTVPSHTSKCSLRRKCSSIYSYDTYCVCKYRYTRTRIRVIFPIKKNLTKRSDRRSMRMKSVSMVINFRFKYIVLVFASASGSKTGPYFIYITKINMNK